MLDIQFDPQNCNFIEDNADLTHTHSTHTQMYVYHLYVHIITYIYVDRCIYIYVLYVCVHVYIYMYIYLYICIYICMHFLKHQRCFQATRPCLWTPGPMPVPWERPEHSDLFFLGKKRKKRRI